MGRGRDGGTADPHSAPGLEGDCSASNGQSSQDEMETWRDNTDVLRYPPTSASIPYPLRGFHLGHLQIKFGSKSGKSEKYPLLPSKIECA